MHNIVGWAWPSTCAEHGAVTCIWLSSECGWTSGHRKSQNIHTRTQELWIRPGYNIQACSTQAEGCGDGMERWQHSSRLLLHALLVASIALYSLESSDRHRHRESGNQDKPHWQIAMQLCYRSSHWIGPWEVSVLVITIEELDQL